MAFANRAFCNAAPVNWNSPPFPPANFCWNLKTYLSVSDCQGNWDSSIYFNWLALRNQLLNNINSHPYHSTLNNRHALNLLSLLTKPVNICGKHQMLLTASVTSYVFSTIFVSAANSNLCFIWHIKYVIYLFKSRWRKINYSPLFMPLSNKLKYATLIRNS